MSREFTFIHVADTHLGANWPAIAARDKVQIPAFGRVFGQVVDHAVKEDADFIVHTGDLIDNPRPAVAAISRLADELPRLKEEKIPFIITKGSHDASRSFFEQMGGNWLYVLDTKFGWLRYVDVGHNPRIDIKTKDDSTVRIYGLGDYGDQQEQMLNQLIGDMKREGSDFGILMMHGSIMEMPRLAGATVSLTKMTPLIGGGLVDYIALGHNHKRWEDEKILAINPGSTEFTSFSEGSKSIYTFIDGNLQLTSTNESPKGFYIVTVEGEMITPRFQPLETRDVRDVIVQFSEATPQQIEEGLVEALGKHAHKRAILRPIMTGTLAQRYRATDIKTGDIVKSISNALYVTLPIISLQGRGKPLLSPRAEMTYQTILQEAFSKVYGDAAVEVAQLADSIVESYKEGGQRAHSKALERIESFDLSLLRGGDEQDAEKA